MPRIIDQPELRFLIRRALQMIPKSVLNGLRDGAPVTHEPALRRATDIIHERLSHLDYVAPDPSKNIFESVGEGSARPAKTGDDADLKR